MDSSELNTTRANRLLSMLSGITRASARADSPDVLYRDVCRIAIECGLFRSAWIGLADRAGSGVRILLGNSAFGEWKAGESERRLADAVLKSGQVCAFNDLSSLPVGWSADELMRRGVGEVAGIPLHEGGKIAAVFVLHAAQAGTMDETTVALLREVGNDISLSLEYMIGEQRRLAAETKLYYMAFYDAQTGLPNRALLDERLPSLAARGALAFLDIRLQRMDRALHLFGRLAMDDVLRVLASRLGAGRGGDDFLAQLGQDEFVLVLPLPCGMEAIEAVAAAALSALEEPVRIGDKEVFLGASIGAVMYPAHEPDLSQLLRRARAAADRSDGEGGFRFYSPKLDKDLEQRARTEAELHRALERSEFELYYQPQLSLRTGEMVGVEALLQWRHPQRGIVGPSEFIPMLEGCGLMPAVGTWVLRQACRQAKAWQVHGFPPLRVGVNLSALQFRLAELVSIVRGALDDAGLAPEYLELELTESLILENVEQTIQVMRGLKKLGVSLSLDDFGTGYSSLSYLRRYPVDRIKIDQSFIRDMVVHTGSAALVRSILAMAHNLGLETIAEGVETAEQFEYLRRQACDEMQGFLFSRAVPAAELARMLSEGRRLPLVEASGIATRGVLLVEEDDKVLAELQRSLTREGWNVLGASSVDEAFSLMAANRIGVVVSGLQGGAFLHRVRHMYPDTVRILLARDADMVTVIDAVNRGEVYRVLAKPVGWEELQSSVRDAYRRHDGQNEFAGN
jgi:diguanylate cyclase (GGDEF)-like protein